MIWMIALLFACISIIFFMGKGSFLIAGYNTASKEEKARYDEKKLCKVMGIGTSIITVALVLSAFGKTEMTTISVVLILLAVVFIIFGTNKYCRSENYDKIVISKKRKWFSRIMLFIILIFVGCMLFTGNITVEIKEKSLKVGYHLLFSGSTEIEYEDIKKISYEKELDIGSRNFGVGSPKIMAGTFENETFEEYKLYSYTNCDYYIVIQTNDGYVVVNDETEETTRKLYDELKHEIDRSKN